MKVLPIFKKNVFALYKRIDFLTLSYIRATASKSTEINETFPDIEKYYPVMRDEAIKWKIGYE
jgi:hypothetical protein